MAGGYPRGESSDLFGQIAQIKGELGRQVQELQTATGTQLTDLVSQVKAKLAELDATVTALVNAALSNYYTKAQTDSKVANPGAISPTAVASSGSVTAATTMSATGNLSTGADLSVTGQMNISGPIFTPHGRANPVVTSYVAAYINSDGRLGATPSSRRFKQQITQWDFPEQALFALQLFAFKYNAAVDELGDKAPLEVGVMAEDLDALGLTWLVVYDDEGKPWAVAYEKIALALLPVVQSHERRIRRLEKAVLNLTTAG